MARGSGSSGSYREWERAQQAAAREKEQAARRQEQERKTREREAAQAEAAARDTEATTKIQQVEHRVEELESLLRASLSRDPRIDLRTLRKSVTLAPLALGPLGVPITPPRWEDFAPRQPGGFAKLLGLGERRFAADLATAESDYARAQTEHQQAEVERQRQVVERRQGYDRKLDLARREVSEHNARVDQMAAGLRTGDRFAVSDYMDLVLRNAPYPRGFPNERHAGYVPESSLLAIEWYLPSVDVIPADKTYRHIKSRKVVEATARPIAEIGSSTSA